MDQSFLQDQQILSKDAEQTIRLGEVFAKSLKAGDILCLFGDLGSGKTTFAKGVAKGLGIDPTKVSSPTFVLMNTYDGKLPVYHFDFYRLDNTVEIATIGYDEFLYGQGVALIEWAERFGNLAPKENISLRFSHQKEDHRLIEFAAQGARYEQLFKAVWKKCGS